MIFSFRKTVRKSSRRTFIVLTLAGQFQMWVTGGLDGRLRLPTRILGSDVKGAFKNQCRIYAKLNALPLKASYYEEQGRIKGRASRANARGAKL
jgi:hypothetical protein